MRRIFHDTEMQRNFDARGYVKVRLLDHELVEGLRQFEMQHSFSPDGAFVPSICNPSKEYRKRVDKQLRDVIIPELNGILIDFKPVFGNFLRKPAARNTDMGLHQDWIFVDETEFVALNVWCSISKSDVNNGTLQVLERSHLLDLPIRGRNIPSPVKEISDHLFRNSTFINAEPGEAVIYDVKLLHGSNTNTSSVPRVAASMVMVPQEAALVHYVAHPNSDTCAYKINVDPEFFTELSLQDFPEKHLVGADSFSFSNRILTITEFNQLWLDCNSDL
jgi:hypothetical protein